MKISSGNYNIFIHKNIRIVRHRIYFSLKSFMYKVKCIFCSAVNLRNAAEGIRILNIFLFGKSQFASLQKFQNLFGGFNLSSVRPYQMHQSIEWAHIAVKSIY